MSKKLAESLKMHLLKVQFPNNLFARRDRHEHFANSFSGGILLRCPLCKKRMGLCISLNTQMSLLSISLDLFLDY